MVISSLTSIYLFKVKIEHYFTNVCKQDLWFDHVCWSILIFCKCIFFLMSTLCKEQYQFSKKMLLLYSSPYNIWIIVQSGNIEFPKNVPLYPCSCHTVYCIAQWRQKPFSHAWCTVYKIQDLRQGNRVTNLIYPRQCFGSPPKYT